MKECLELRQIVEPAPRLIRPVVEMLQRQATSAESLASRAAASRSANVKSDDVKDAKKRGRPAASRKKVGH